MKQVFYCAHFTQEDGRVLTVGPFFSRGEADRYPKEGHGATFTHIERSCHEATQEEILRRACVICGQPIGYYESSWLENGMSPDHGKRACHTHPRPHGFSHYSDG